jgi:hypothetical protein
LRANQFAAQGDFLGALAIGHEAEVTDAVAQKLVQSVVKGVAGRARHIRPSGEEVILNPGVPFHRHRKNPDLIPITIGNQPNATSSTGCYIGHLELLSGRGLESWPRLSEQFPAKDKWRSAGFGLQLVAGRLSRCRAGVAQPELRQTPGGEKFMRPSRWLDG